MPAPSAVALDEQRLGWTLAAAYRSPFLALSILSTSEIVEVRRHRIADGARGRVAMARAIAEAVLEYDVAELVTEPGLLAPAILAGRGRPVRTCALRSAKDVLLPEDVKKTTRNLCQHLVERFESLRRFVTILPATGRIAMTERWRTVMLLPVALGLAAQRVHGRPRT